MNCSFYTKLLCLAMSAYMLALPAFSLELDMSVDEEIRKNYNPSQLELDALPPVPGVPASTPLPPKKTTAPVSSSTNNKPPKSLPVGETSSRVGRVQKTLPKTDAASESFTAIKIKKGTKFKVVSKTKVSDWSQAGARMSFVSLAPVTQRYVTIPQGTIFKAVVVDSHPPQGTGNGGLIVIKADQMIFRGATYYINAKITKANSKKIFFNNIKGKRGYLKGIAKSIQPGSRFYKKAMRGTSKLAQNKWTLILTPFTAVAGVVVYGVNIIGSPLFAMFSKGGHITIPAGVQYEIKLLDDVYMY